MQSTWSEIYVSFTPSESHKEGEFCKPSSSPIFLTSRFISLHLEWCSLESILDDYILKMFLEVKIQVSSYFWEQIDALCLSGLPGGSNRYWILSLQCISRKIGCQRPQKLCNHNVKYPKVLYCLDHIQYHILNLFIVQMEMYFTADIFQKAKEEFCFYIIYC